MCTNEWVTERIAAELRDPGIGFMDLIQRLDGTSPFEIEQSLQELAPERVPRSATVRPHACDPWADILPMPHPVNGGWRFTPASASDLYELGSRDMRDSDHLLLFGCPTVALASRKKEVACGASVVDVDPGVIATIRHRLPRASAVCCDLRDLDTEAFAGCRSVVLDPPWYLDDSLAFIATACRCLQLGGNLIVVVPPIGVRKSVQTERQTLLSTAESWGLEFVQLQKSRVQYVAPFFEQQALKAARLDFVPRTWRCGDLILFRKTRSVHVDFRPQLRRDDWHVCDLNDSRVAIRETAADPLAGPLDQAVPGGVLPAVSRRDPRLRGVSIWTSGNRVYRSSCPSRIKAAIMGMSVGTAASPPMHPISDVLQHLVEVVSEEHTEYLQDGASTNG
jgi:hypothetical protein